MGRLEDLTRVYTSPLYWSIRFACITPFVLLAVAMLMLGSFYPSFSIQTFYVPALNKFNINQTTLPDSDSLIFFDLQLQNSMEYKGVRYGPVNVTISYATANTSVPIGTYEVGGFYQGKGKTARRRDVAVATGAVGWREAAMSALSSGSTVDFGVDLHAEVKFNNYLWYTSKKRMVSRGIVKVGDSGRKVGEKPVQLNNSRPPFSMRVGNFLVICIFVLLGLFVVAFFILVCYASRR